MSRFPSYPHLDALLNAKFIEEDNIIEHECGGEEHSTSRDCLQSLFDLPFAPTVCSEIIEDWESAEAFIQKHIGEYKFIKGCTLSPKDWKDPPVFESAEDALVALKNSQRTKHIPNKRQHLVMKKRRDYISMSRCFWVECKLKMVCGNMDHEKVITFTEKYKSMIPYYYCCYEIGEYIINGESCIEFIEFNTFGENCCIAPFDWENDWERLFIWDKISFGDV